MGLKMREMVGCVKRGWVVSLAGVSGSDSLIEEGLLSKHVLQIDV